VSLLLALVHLVHFSFDRQNEKTSIFSIMSTPIREKADQQLEEYRQQQKVG
jgi:hypothetical protein